MIFLWLLSSCAAQMPHVVDFANHELSQQDARELSSKEPLFTLETFLEALMKQRSEEIKWLRTEMKILEAEKVKAKYAIAVERNRKSARDHRSKEKS